MLGFVINQILSFFSLPTISFSTESRFGLCLFNTDQNCINLIATLPCLLSLFLSGFDYFNFDRYNEWFNDNSTFLLAETGIYQGADEIQEYVAFIQAKYFSSFTSEERLFLQIAEASWNTCQVNLFFTNTAILNSAVTGSSGCLEFLGATKIKYTPGFAALFGGFVVNQVTLFYPGPLLAQLFGTALNTNEVGAYVCGVMENSCNSTFVANNLTTSPDACPTKFSSLDPVGPDGYLDGNTKGCRILHAAFAESNDAHCAHISFIPELDPKGQIKCQTGDGLELSDLFTPQELDDIVAAGVQFGLDPETLYTSECQL